MTFSGDAAVAIISQVGEDCEIKRNTASGADSYRNPNKDYTTVGTERVARLYPNRSARPNQQDMLAGELDTDDPVLMWPTGADIQDGDKVVWHSGLPADDRVEYRVRSVLRYPTHVRAQAQKV